MRQESTRHIFTLWLFDVQYVICTKVQIHNIIDIARGTCNNIKGKKSISNLYIIVIAESIYFT